MKSAPSLNSGLASPFEQFFLVLGVVYGLPMVFGAPAPQATEHLLSPLLVHVWATFLAGGCLTALIGTHWEQLGHLANRRTRNDTSLLLERLGLVAAGVGTLIYAIGLVLIGFPGFLAFAYGLACFWRAGQITLWIRAAIRDKGIR